MSQLTAFIIGAGSNIGLSTAAALKAHGYRVAVGARNPNREQAQSEGYFPVAMDVQNSESMKAAFVDVTNKLGPPSVVVFNAAFFEFAPNPEDPLTLSMESLTKQASFGLAVFAAAQEALHGFRSDTLKDVLKTFIITGNAQPWNPTSAPAFFGLNIQKIIEWRLAELFTFAYSRESIRFYFATLVSKSGGVEDFSEFLKSGPQHAQVFLGLATRKEQVNWDYRFTLDGKEWNSE